MGKNNLDYVRGSAINFLYSFIPLDHTGFSKDVYDKRDKQLKELKHIYQRINENITFKHFRIIVYNAIVRKYNETPYHMLNRLIMASNRNEAISGDVSDEVAAKKVDAITVNGKESIWKTIKKIVDWIIGIIDKLGGNQNPNVYAPKNRDWQYENRPKIQLENGAGIQESSSSLLPLLLLGSAGFLMMKKSTPKPKTRTKN